MKLSLQKTALAELDTLKLTEMDILIDKLALIKILKAFAWILFFFLLSE